MPDIKLTEKQKEVKLNAAQKRILKLMQDGAMIMTRYNMLKHKRTIYDMFSPVSYDHIQTVSDGSFCALKNNGLIEFNKKVWVVSELGKNIKL